MIIEAGEMLKDEEKVSSEDIFPEILDAESFDRSFPEEVKKLSNQNVYYCFQCGTCVTGCTVTDFGQNTKRLIRKIIFGLKEEVLNDDSIWLCSECYCCAERCPQGVKLPIIWITLRNMAAERGIVPMNVKYAINAIKSTGRIVEVPEATEVKRERLNLPRIGKLSNDIINEINQIFEKSDFILLKTKSSD